MKKLTEQQALKICKKLGYILGKLYVRQNVRSNKMVGFSPTVYDNSKSGNTRRVPYISLVYRESPSRGRSVSTKQ